MAAGHCGATKSQTKFPVIAPSIFLPLLPSSHYLSPHTHRKKINASIETATPTHLQSVSLLLPELFSLLFFFCISFRRYYCNSSVVSHRPQTYTAVQQVSHTSLLQIGSFLQSHKTISKLHTFFSPSTSDCICYSISF